MPSNKDLHSLKGLIVKEFAERYKSGMNVDAAKMFSVDFREYASSVLPSIDIDECIKILHRQGNLEEFIDGSFVLKDDFINRYLPR